MHRAVRHTACRFFVLSDDLPLRRSCAAIQKPLPNHLHGLVRRVHEVVGIETVIPQFIEDYLVRREILRLAFPYKSVRGKLQGRLAECV